MVHIFSRLGVNIAFDSASGSVHVVDDVARDIVSCYGKTPRGEAVTAVAQKHGIPESEVEECFDDVDELVREGKLFSEDKFRPDITFVTSRPTVVKALCLHIAHTCNLDCDYCFASQGRYHGERALMSFEVGKRAIDFLIENSGTRHNLEVDFFGGEPLMNFDVVKKSPHTHAPSNSRAANTSVSPSPPTVCLSTTMSSSSPTARWTMSS